MKSFSSVKAVTVRKRLLNGTETRRPMWCFMFASLLVITSIVIPLSCSAGTGIDPMESTDGLDLELRRGTASGTGGTSGDLQQSSDSWPMFRHDLNHTGYSTSHVPDNPSVRWTFQAVDGFESSPVVKYGMVFIGSDDYNLYALNEDTGELVWNFTTGYYVGATPAVADGKVFVGSIDGRFYALDAFSGNLVWIFDRPSSEGDKTQYDSSPAVDAIEGRVYTGVRVRNSKSGDEHQEFYCLNMTTGELLWKVDHSYGGLQSSSPSVSENAVFISLGEKVLSFDKMTGQQLWEFPTPGSFATSSPAVANHTVFIQICLASDSILALDQHSGSLKWKFDFPSGLAASSPAYHDGVVFVGSWDFNVYAFDAGTGDVLWKYLTGQVVQSSPAVADGKVIVASGDKYLYVLNENDGSLAWRSVLGRASASSPAVSNGKIFVSDGHVAPRGDLGTLFAFGPPPRSIELNIDPDTLNLNSMGKWITAYITTENASIEDIDPSSLLLNDLIPPAWWNIQNDTTLMVKFDRSAVEAVLPVSNAVDIKITGQWKDGEAFEVHDIIRVIDVGGHREIPLPIHSIENIYGTSWSGPPSLLVQDLTLRTDHHVIEVSIPVSERLTCARFVENGDAMNTLKYSHPFIRTLI